MNIFQFIKRFTIDQYVFGIDDPEPAPDPDPAPEPDGDPAPEPDGDPAPEPDGDPPKDSAPEPDPDPDSWSVRRAEMAGDDKAMLNDMSRYDSLEKWIDSGWSAKQTIRKGEVSKGLPDDPTPEQLSEFREANGIPVEPTDYKFDGLEMTETDTRVMGAVAQVAHQYNISNEALNALTEAHLTERDGILDEMDQQDGLDKGTCEKMLKEHWKGDYEANMGAVESLMAGLPQDVREDVMTARTGSGKALFNSPEFIQWMTDAALKINPMAAIPGGGENPVGTADAVIREVQKLYADGKSDEYFKDTALQARYDAAIAVYTGLGKAIPKFH